MSDTVLLNNAIPVAIHVQVHLRALEASTRYKRSESDLIDALEQVEAHKVYLHRDYTSLFQYSVKELGLSENVAYTLITVMRKAKEIPELKTEIKAGRITLSNAKRIAPVLTEANQDEWIKKASQLSQRQLEKEVVKIRPMSAVSERVTYITESRNKLELGLFEKDMLKLRRAQDLVSQSSSKHASLEETLIEITEYYLKHRDPVVKAKRVLLEKGLSSTSSAYPTRLETSSTLNAGGNRQTIPALILHQVNLRDQRRCMFTHSTGKVCMQTRWTEIHHQIPVEEGGENTLENLVTLCSTHHRWVHNSVVDRRK